MKLEIQRWIDEAAGEETYIGRDPSGEYWVCVKGDVAKRASLAGEIVLACDEWKLCRLAYVFGPKEAAELEQDLANLWHLPDVSITKSVTVTV